MGRAYQRRGVHPKTRAKRALVPGGIALQAGQLQILSNKIGDRCLSPFFSFFGFSLSKNPSSISMVSYGNSDSSLKILSQ